MRLSLRFRLPITFLLLISLAAAGASFAVLPTLKNHFLQERQVALLTQGSIIANAVREEFLSDGQGIPYITRTFAQRLSARVLIINHDAVVIADAYGELQGTRLQHESVLASLRGRSVVLEQTSAEGEPALYVLVPISRVERLDEGQAEIVGSVFISSSLVDMYETLANLRRSLLLGALTTGFFAALAGLYMSFVIVKPISELTEGAKKISAGSLGAQVPVQGDRETHELARTFNHMSTRLAAVEEARRRFISDASHELRTPLAAVKALIEPIVADADTEPETVREFLLDVNKEVDRLSDLVSDLLQLAQLDSKPALELEATDMGEVIRGVISTLAPLAQSKGIGLKYNTVPCEVQVDPRKLHRAILNIVDNAIKFAERHVQVDVELSGTRVVINVKDDGPGVPVEARKRIFERFYRLDSARVRSTGGGGLGLAIAMEIVQLHGGRIDVSGADQGGSSFKVSLPLTKS